MMSDTEISFVLLRLLSDTRTYRGVKFASCFVSDAVERKYATALWNELPLTERAEVSASFDRIYSACAAIRAADFLATHQAPCATQ